MLNKQNYIFSRFHFFRIFNVRRTVVLHFHRYKKIRLEKTIVFIRLKMITRTENTYKRARYSLGSKKSFGNKTVVTL